MKKCAKGMKKKLCSCCHKSMPMKKMLITPFQWAKIRKGSILSSGKGKARMVLWKSKNNKALVFQHAYDPLKESCYWYGDIYYKYKIIKL